MSLKNPDHIFFKSNRFDLFFKYLYLKYSWVQFEHKSFFENIYLHHIKIFNNFNEQDKESPEDFIEAFKNTFDDIKQRGFDKALDPIPVDESMEPIDGAHRLSICTLLNEKIPVIKAEGKKRY